MRIHILRQDFQSIRIVDGDVAVATRHDLGPVRRPGETVHRTGIDRKFGYDLWAGGAEVNSPDLDHPAVGTGDNFDKVSAAGGAAPVSDTTFDPGPLEPGKTYYWRVDEFSSPNTIKGGVWSFTTAEPAP